MKHPDVPHDPIGSVVSAAFGLVAFLLAFTFQIAANRFDSRKELLYEEVQEIRTAYLQAGLIPEPYGPNTKKHLVEYVDLRVDLAKDQSKLDQALSRSQLILDSLWSYTEALAAIDRSSEVYSLYTTAINNIVNAYNKRITVVLVYRIPSAVLLVLTVIVILSMFILGYQFGISGKGIPGLNLLVAVLFAIVMFLIFALDRPETGLIRLNQKPIQALQQQLHEKQQNVSHYPTLIIKD
jgi:hypothetical protein